MFCIYWLGKEKYSPLFQLRETRWRWGVMAVLFLRMFLMNFQKPLKNLKSRQKVTLLTTQVLSGDISLRSEYGVLFLRKDYIWNCNMFFVVFNKLKNCTWKTVFDFELCTMIGQNRLRCLRSDPFMYLPSYVYQITIHSSVPFSSFYLLPERSQL